MYHMRINILHSIDGAKNATGLTVIIDVFRAFTCACYVIGNGAKRVIPIGDINLAYSLKKQNPDYILMGERNAKKPEGFDFGNSPTEIEKIDFTNKTVIHTTSSGTQGIANANQAEKIITGSFVNAKAIAKYINHYNPNIVSLVAMGEPGDNPTVEDNSLAEYLNNLLMNKKTDLSQIKIDIENAPSAKKFYDKNKTWVPETDVELCLAFNKYNFVLEAVEYKDDLVALQRVDV